MASFDMRDECNLTHSLDGRPQRRNHDWPLIIPGNPYDVIYLTPLPPPPPPPPPPPSPSPSPIHLHILTRCQVARPQRNVTVIVVACHRDHNALINVTLIVVSKDLCGVCNGDNSTCVVLNGSFNQTQYGYNHVTRIPAGSSSLDIRQKGYQGSNHDDNYLALMDPQTGEYLLNGNFVVSVFQKTIQFGGTTIEYSGSDAVMERLNSSKPLKKDVVIQVRYSASFARSLRLCIGLVYGFDGFDGFLESDHRYILPNSAVWPVQSMNHAN